MSRPGAVAAFTGHRISPPGVPGRFPASAEGAVAAAIRSALEAHGVAAAYGSLACGADILVAEALLARGGELHVVLPFAAAEFRETSVRSGGPGWEERFERCLAAASSLTQVTSGGYGGDDGLYDRAARLAMDLAVERARAGALFVLQLAVWDGSPAAGAAGTAVDVATWEARGLPRVIIDPRHPGAS